MTGGKTTLANSIVFRLSLFLSVLLIASVGVAGALITILGNEAPLVETRAAINADIEALEAYEELSGISEVLKTVTQRSLDDKNAYFYTVHDSSAVTVAGSPYKWSWNDAQRSDFGFRLIEVPYDQLRLPTQSPRPFSGHYDILVKRHEFESGYVIFVGRNIDELEAATWIASTLGWAVIGTLILLLGYIFWFSHYVVSRVRDFSRTATEIVNTGDLSLRIDQDTNWDDLGKLAVTWNNMLDEIQSLVTKIQNTSNNIAHDLRTPLTRMRVDLENVENPEQREELMREADTLLDIVNGLLRIAEIESGAARSAFRTINLTEILEDVVSFYLPVAEEKSITLNVELSDVTYHADRDLLFQAFMNVLDNAIKFTPVSGEVTVTLDQSDTDTVVTICDTGSGIPELEQSEVFERFYRRDESRTSPGYGLGLSLVWAITELHGASVNMISRDPGLCVKFVFPRSGI
ncbi:MAG: HAMP domain-containing sensor histidine kinase [Pseudomonadota bacterium]